MEIIIGIVVGLISALIIFFFVYKRGEKKQEETSKEMMEAMELKFKSLLPELMKSSNETLVSMANEKLGSEKKEIRTDLENKREEIERMVKVIQQDLKSNQEQLVKSDKERIGSFNKLQSQLDEYSKVTDKLAVSTESLKKVLSNNQLRGQFGEQVAEDLLRMAGFVKGTSYKVQEDVNGNRPDFTVYMPDGTKINVDAKFPFSNLQKMAESEDKEQKKSYMQLFEKDVKEKIKQVSTRDYINPEDNTVDFVILFIPNEMIFSYIYDKLPDVWQDAMEKKVILAGPFSFTAILRMVKQAYENFRYQANIRDIIGLIQSFEKEFVKYNDEFEKIGSKIESLQKQYNTVSVTRTNKLMGTVDKIKIADDGDQAELKLLEDN
jgi:DNA recombination protein RmuC